MSHTTITSPCHRLIVSILRRCSVALLVLLVSPPLWAQTAVFRGLDRSTGGAYRGQYGALGMDLPLDGGSVQEPAFARGVGSQFNMPRFSFDPRFPHFFSTRNCCNPVTADGVTVGQGELWPADARCGCGWYNRTADGVPMRYGITLSGPRRLTLLMIDHDRIGRIQRLDLYEQLPDVVDEPGSAGISRANGRLLDSQIVDLQGGTVYARWDVSGPVNVVFTPLSPGTGNGMAVLNGVFLDSIPASDPQPEPAPGAPTNLRVVP